MKWVAQQSEWDMERICGQVMHLRIFHTILGESGLLKLPIEVIAAVFKHMKERDIVIWVLKMVKDLPPQRHIHHIPEAVEIWRGADEDTARTQNIKETSEYEIPRYRQMLYDFRKENEVEFGVKRRLGFAYVPMNRFHALLRHV
jgi:hypothetical protein